jgi:predicted RNase H-like nuclease
MLRAGPGAAQRKSVAELSTWTPYREGPRIPDSGTVHYLGIDLAWGERARTGVAVLDATGRLVTSTSVVSDDEIVDALRPWTSAPGLVAAVDAPLVVPNLTGRRPCEAQVSAAFGRFSAGAYPANRSNPLFAGEPRAARLARRFGWQIDPATPLTPSTGLALEVYPHPAMVALFGLETVIPYKLKAGRELPGLRAAYARLLDHLEETCGRRLGLQQHRRWAELRSTASGAVRKSELDRIEDEVDAIFCAYLAWLWVHERGSLTVWGDVHEGYIVTPHPPRGAAAPHLT